MEETCVLLAKDLKALGEAKEKAEGIVEGEPKGKAEGEARGKAEAEAEIFDAIRLFVQKKALEIISE